jgi:tetratricopeptide (TPR) repeat protein
MKQRGFFLLLVALLSFSPHIFAQKELRRKIRLGNNEYKDSIFVKAETNYRKALDLNNKSGMAGYNLGRVLSAQGKKDKAIKQYDKAAKIVKDKKQLASIYHNKGVLLQEKKKYAESIEAYKESLKNNPHKARITSSSNASF